MNVRYWLTFLVMIHVNFLFAQFHGDVNRDGVIDATDYYSLKQFLITRNPTNSCDINNDGLYNVADIVVLENYLFREGKSSFESKKIKESDNILVFPGKIDVGESYIDIVVSEIEGLSAFEFNLEGVDSIQEIIGGEALKNRAIVFRGNKLICTPGPNKFERLVSKNIIRIKFFSNSHLDDLQICISEPVFTNIEAEMLNVQIGECANKYYAISGLTDLKEKVIGSRNKDFESDINKDGFTNVVEIGRAHV